MRAVRKSFLDEPWLAEIIEQVNRHDVVDDQLDAEAAAVLDEKKPDVVVEPERWAFLLLTEFCAGGQNACLVLGVFYFNINKRFFSTELDTNLMPKKNVF